MKKLFKNYFLFNILISALIVSCSDGDLSGSNTNKSSEKNPIIIMKTSMGDIIIELYRDVAPETVDNFLGLAMGTKEFTDPVKGTKVKRKYYDGLTFHRVIPGFMIQGGDILGNGSGGPGYSFKDEINAKGLHLDEEIVGSSNKYVREAQMYVFKKLGIKSQEDLNARLNEVKAEFEKVKKLTAYELLEKMGYKYNDKLKTMAVDKYTIAMANSGPNTNGSQFFINLADNHYLNGKHTVFGKVIKGSEVAEKIASVPRDKKDKPIKPVIIKSIEYYNK